MSSKVLHVSQPGEGGAARVVADLADDQARRGYDVVVAGPPGSELAGWLANAGVRLIEWRASRSPGRRVVAERRALARVIAAERPHLLHLHSSKAGLVGRLSARGRTPTLFQPHSWSFEAVRGPMRLAATAWERKGARWTHALVCVSEAERRRGEEAGIHAPFHVVPNGVDVVAFVDAEPGERSAVRRRLGLDEAPLAVCVGRLCHQKGQDVLVRAWPLVRARVPDARLVLVGGGPAEVELRRAASPGVELIGPHENVREWLVAADVVAFPSRWEGMSLALLEALACGRSVVATDVPGTREALGDEAGAVVAVEAVESLADAVALRLIDAGRAAEEGAAGRRRVEQLYDLRTTCDRMAALYSDLLDRRRERESSGNALTAPPAR